MTNHLLLTGVTLLVCLTLSFLFSGMESGVMALNRVRIRQLARSGDPRAAVLQGFLREPESFLWTILVGNTVANFALFLLGALALRAWLGGRAAFWAPAFVVVVFIFYVGCEVLPKTLFRRYPNRLSLMMARPFRAIHRALMPLVALADWFARMLLRWTGGSAYTARLFTSRDEMRFVMQEAAPSLTSEERSMINRVLDLQSLRVERITIPMANVVSVDALASLPSVLAICQERRLTRVPVVDRAARRIIGIVNLEYTLYNEDLDAPKTARELMQPALFLAADMDLEEALRRMQRAGSRLAVVLAEDRSELGVISLQDILKVIFGRVTL